MSYQAVPPLDIRQIRSGGHFEISSQVFVKAKFYFGCYNYSQGSRYGNYTTGWTVRSSNAGRGKRFVLLQNVQTACCPPSLQHNGYRDSFPDVKRPECKITTQLRVVPRLRMSGSIPLLPVYAYMASTRKTLTCFSSLAYGPYSPTSAFFRMITHTDIFCSLPSSLDIHILRIILSTV
jgi:hypothetical protein